MKAGEIGIQLSDGLHSLVHTLNGVRIMSNQACQALIHEKTTALRDAIVSDMETIFQQSAYSIKISDLSYSLNKPVYSVIATISLLI
jgi:hypothetical protein